MFFFIGDEDLEKLNRIKNRINSSSDLICDLFLELEFEKVDDSLKSTFSINDACNLGYKFLSERYPMMIDNYCMSIKNPDIFKVDNNNEQINIIKFICDRYFYFLSFKSSKKAFKLLKEECDNSKVLKKYFEVAYHYLYEFDNEFKEQKKIPFTIKPLYKSRFNKMLNYDLEKRNIFW